MNEDIGKALKIILERLKEANKEEDNNPLPNNCCNCKYRHGEEYYDQQWGDFSVVIIGVIKIENLWTLYTYL